MLGNIVLQGLGQFRGQGVPKLGTACQTDMPQLRMGFRRMARPAVNLGESGGTRLRVPCRSHCHEEEDMDEYK